MAVIVHAADVVLPVAEADGTHRAPIADGGVAVAGDRIVSVGPLDEVMRYVRAHGDSWEPPGSDPRPSSGHAAEPRLRRWRGVLTPGLVNAHTHLQYTAMADLGADPPPFDRWLAEMGRRRRVTTPQQWAESARTGAFLALRSGTTMVADVVTDDAALLPVARSGLGGISYLEVAPSDATADAASVAHRLAARLAAAPPGRAVGLAPHAPATLDAATVTAIVALAAERGLRVHTHLAESTDELRLVADGSGPLARLLERAGIASDLVGRGAGTTPARHADRLGVLGGTTHVAHGVHLDADDRRLLRSRHTAVALCVRSNRVLRAGRPPVADYLAENSPLAVGTDSLASSPSLDLWEEVAAVAALARDQGYGGPDLADRLVRAVTWDGARALGFNQDGAPVAGALVVGARADLAVFDVSPGPAGAASEGPAAALVARGGGSCRATVVAGRIVHRR